MGRTAGLHEEALSAGAARMKASTRYGLAGIAALAVLSLVHWLREIRFSGGDASDYLIGVAPNLCAAVAIAFVVLSVWADQQKQVAYPAARRWFLISAAISGVGLLGWEFFQRTSDNLVFDPHDIAATLAGLLVSAAIFQLVTPRAAETAAS